MTLACGRVEVEDVEEVQPVKAEVDDAKTIALTLACGRVEVEDVEEVQPVEAEVDDAKTITELFDNAYAIDPIPNDVLDQLRRGQTHSKQLSLAECQKDDNGRLLYRKRIYVPNYMPLKLQLIRDFHETPAAGHPGRSKTLELLARHYY